MLGGSLCDWPRNQQHKKIIGKSPGSLFNIEAGDMSFSTATALVWENATGGASELMTSANSHHKITNVKPYGRAFKIPSKRPLQAQHLISNMHHMRDAETMYWTRHLCFETQCKWNTAAIIHNCPVTCLCWHLALVSLLTIHSLQCHFTPRTQRSCVCTYPGKCWMRRIITAPSLKASVISACVSELFTMHSVFHLLMVCSTLECLETVG